MVVPINEVSLASAAEKILPEVTDTIYNIDNRTPWSLNVAVDVSFLLLIDQIEATEYKVSKEG